MIHRFISSLLAKRFVILTGMSGSGKTKLAQAFAAWITPNTLGMTDCFREGTVIRSQRINYFVKSSDEIAVEFWNSEDENSAVRVVLPRALISEWVTCIKENNFTEGISAREIRAAVEKTTKFSTQLNSFETHLKAAAFAVIESKWTFAPHMFYCVVSVGADWTNNENILGYADALNPQIYVRMQALDLILQARERPDFPHFLILDEMNLSHVERYFADILSAIESVEPLHLHNDKNEMGDLISRDGVPASLHLPSNVFIIGTVNVDETTYMFSPKVLDRANVIEFRVQHEQIERFLTNPTSIKLEKISGLGSTFAKAFKTASLSEANLEEEVNHKLKEELLLFFDVMSECGGEFGFRTAKEIARFVYFHKRLCSTDWRFHQAMDAQIFQRILPKLHGSRKKIEQTLLKIAALCYFEHLWKIADGDQEVLENRDDLLLHVKQAGGVNGKGLIPLEKAEREPSLSTAYFQLSYEKLVRMLKLLEQNGFTSFAEA